MATRRPTGGSPPRVDQAHQAIFEAEKPFGGPGGTLLTVRLSFEDGFWKTVALGRFRLWVTASPDPVLWRSLLAQPGVNGWTRLAAAHMARGEGKLALTALDRAAGAEKTGHDPFLRALILDGLGRQDEARKQLEDGLGRMDSTADEVLRRLAVAALGASLKRSGDDVALLARRGHQLTRLGENERARADFARAARLAPKDGRWPARVAQLGPKVLAFWSFDFDADGWKPSATCRLTPANPGLRVEGSGADNYLTVAVKGPAGWKELTIRARVASPLVGKVLWGTTSAKGTTYGGWHAQWFSLPASGTDWRDYRVLCRADEPIVNLRLSVRDPTGKLELDAITLREVAGDEGALLQQTAAAADLRPKDLRIQFARGNLHSRMGQHSVAKADFEMALGIERTEALARHRTFAEAYEKQGKAVPAIEHLSVLIEANKGKADEAALLFRRGALLGRLGRWEQAAADYSAGLRLNPADHWNWYSSATLKAYTADRQGYLRDCLQMRQRFGTSNLPYVVERTAKAALLLPGGDAKVLTALAERALEGSEAEDGYHWLLLARGMAAYRAGDFKDALAWLRKSLQQTPAGANWDNARSLAQFFTAMSRCRVEPADPAGAQKAFKKGVEAMEHYYPKRDAGNRADWINWIYCERARREAEALLKAADKKR
jgi:tetratricopeptide (TPR) repeat protein